MARQQVGEPAGNARHNGQTTGKGSTGSQGPSHRIGTRQQGEGNGARPGLNHKGTTHTTIRTDAATKAQTTRTVTTRQQTALDLFSGTGSVKRVLEALGYHVTSVDIDPRWQPDIVTDITRWRYWEEFFPGQFDVITVSSF